MKLNLKLIFVVLIVIITLSLFWSLQVMPRHVDSWILISQSDYILDSQTIDFKEPFSGEGFSNPLGSHVLVVVVSSISGLDILSLGFVFRILIFIILSFLVYGLSKSLFNNEKVAAVCGLFTPLILTNMTMLGPAYFVPLAFATILAFLFFIFLIKEKWFLMSLSFIILALTHASTMVFALIVLFLYFLFNRKYWKKFWIFFVILILGIIFFVSTHGFGFFIQKILELTAFHKLWPYFKFDKMLTYTFIPFFALGIYFIISKEKKARRFLIPLIVFLALEMFLFWYWKGFAIRYRRIIYYIFMLLPFFVGYGVYNLSYYVDILISKFRKLKFIVNYKLILILILVILVPLAINLNINQRSFEYTFVNEEENVLLENFGNEYPNGYLAAGALQSYALPYYELKPVQISPGHIGKQLYYRQLFPCFYKRDVDCLIGFFREHPEFQYIYTRTKINSTYFEPLFVKEGLIIYEYKDLNITNNLE